MMSFSTPFYKEYVSVFMFIEEPRPLNSKIDNELRGVANIRGLLNEHDDTTLAALDIPRITKKLKKAPKKLKARYDEYKRRFIRDENGEPVLPILGTAQDGIGQTKTYDNIGKSGKIFLGICKIEIGSYFLKKKLS
jgi:hypothetical protein